MIDGGREVIVIVVTHTNESQTSYEVPAPGGWHLNTRHRTLVIGRGVPRTVVPLDSVLNFEIVHPEPRPNLDTCPSRGPRIGEEVAYCQRAAGHTGKHRWEGERWW